MEQLDQWGYVGFPNYYVGRREPYFTNAPLWSRPYTFCQTDADCTVNAGGSGPRCLGLDFNLDCQPGDTCICTNAINASRLNCRKRKK
jgi:hypothetical protein